MTNSQKNLLSFLVCLTLVCTKAYGQYNDNEVSRTLELSTHDGFSDQYQVRTDDFTAGGSSLQILPNIGNFNSGVTGGFFVEDNITVTFDYKYTKHGSISPESEVLQLIYDSPNGLITKQLVDTSGEWCTRSYFLGSQVGSVQWSIVFAYQSQSEILFDNFRVVNGNRPEVATCREGPPRTESAVIISPILTLLLDDDGQEPIAPPRAPSVYGTISLPVGKIAPLGGVTLSISTFPLDFTFIDGIFRSSQVDVVIPEGENSATYELPFLVDGEGVTRDIQIECEIGCFDIDVAGHGFWSTSTGLTNFLFASNFNVNEATEAPITLVPADRFSGSVAMPGGEVAIGNEQIAIRIVEVLTDFGFPTSYSFYYYPKSGDRNIDFQVGVPTDRSNSGWKMEVSCNSCGSFIATGTQYLSYSGGYQLSTESAESITFLTNLDLSSINVELVEQE